MASFKILYKDGVTTKTLSFKKKRYVEKWPVDGVTPSIHEQLRCDHEVLFDNEEFANLIDSLELITDEDEILNAVEILSRYERTKRFWNQ